MKAPKARTDRSKLTTERRNPRSSGLDRLTALQIVDLINAEDAGVAGAVRRQRRRIAAAAELAKGCPVLLTGGIVEVRTLAGLTPKG